MHHPQRIPETLKPEGGKRLAPSHDSLARSVDAPVPGTASALSLAGGVSWRPREGRTIVFGRNRPEVHVCLGENDLNISRRHGTLTCRDGRWWVDNTGIRPIRLAETRLLFRDEEPFPLDPGYTPIFVRGSQHREHLLEVFVTGSDMAAPAARPGHRTNPAKVWPLSDEEKLALVALGQRYLLHEPRPQPWSWDDTANLLARIQPAAGWKRRRVDMLVTAVRARLHQEGVLGLTREEVQEPLGNSLNHNLLQELLLSTTLVPRDLELLGP